MSGPVELAHSNPAYTPTVAKAGLTLPLSPASAVLLERCAPYTRLTPQSLKNPVAAKTVPHVSLAPLQMTKLGRDYVPEAIIQALDIEVRRITREQNNTDAIVLQALAEVESDARPQEIEEDWLHNFFDKCRLTSDVPTQALWAKLLARKAGQPGEYSKRTTNLLQGLGPEEVTQVQTLCQFCVTIEAGGQQFQNPLVLEASSKFGLYYRNGISLDRLQDLQSIGLVQIKPNGEHFLQNIDANRGHLRYFGEKIGFQFLKPSPDQRNRLDLGQILFTPQGHKIASLCSPTPLPDFGTYLIRQMNREGESNLFRTA